MFRRSSLLALLVAGFALIASAQTGNPPQKKVAVTVDASKTGEPITKYIYGQFIEHIGDLINRGMWAEMIDDRKFYYDVNSKPDERRPVRGRRLNPWRPVGPDEFVVMDRQHPYVGDQTPLIKPAGATPRGIQQAGLALRKGKAYTGRVVLAGDPGVKVAVNLIWGPNPRDRQTVPVAPRTAYAKFPLKFTAAADTDDGRIEITGTGSGSFHVGAVSLMPADNLQGFRPEVIAALKQLNSGIYRFPGGNFLSNHDWHDAIGDPDKRPPRWDNAWSAVQPNDVGTDELINMCNLLGVEPYISVNAGFGDAHSAAEQVEYVNGSADTPMGKLRAANGHPAPYNVKWWGIGNEMYGSWQFGNMALKQWVIKHNMFAKAMRQVDPTIKLTAGGASPDEMAVTNGAMRLTGKSVAEYGSDADWTGAMFANCLDYMDVMTEHFYSYDGQRFDIAQGKRIDVKDPLIEWARMPANRVRCKVESYEEYLKRIPGLKEKKIPINIDEWAYSRVRPNLKQALANAWVFHEMFRHSDIIKMAAHTMATGCIDADATSAALNLTGVTFKLYRDHFGTVPVEVTGDSPQPAPLRPVGADQPKVNAGSPTYPVDVAAALSSDGKLLTVAIMNPVESAQDLNMNFKGIDIRGKGRMWLITAPDVNATISLGQKPGVEVVETAVNETPKTLRIPPISISLYEFEKR